MRTHFSCFSGIAGMEIAAEAADFTTVGQVEIADYPVKHVLERVWPDVPRWRDIRDVTEESLKEKGIGNITVLSGGFPCQPFSTAGKRKGKGDDRYLWDELIRVIRCVKPTWFVGENVAGITSMEQSDCIAELEGEEGSQCMLYYAERILPGIIRDLEKEGFLLPRHTDGTPIIFTIPACAVNAPHRRMRVFIIAYNPENARRNATNSQNNGRNGRASSERWGKQDRFEGREMGDQSCGQDTDASDNTGSRIGGLPILQGESREDNTNFVGEDCFAPESENDRCKGGNSSERRELPDRAGWEEAWDQPFGQDRDAPDIDRVRRNDGADRGEGIQRNETCNEAGTGDQPPGDVADTILSEASRLGGNSGDVHRITESEVLPYSSAWEIPWPEVATCLCRVSDGFSAELDGSRRFRVDRLKCLGNAVVPA